MSHINPIKKQKFTLNEKYMQFLVNLTHRTDRLSNRNNIMDDVNSTDKHMVKKLRAYMRAKEVGHRSNRRMAEPIDTSKHI